MTPTHPQNVLVTGSSGYVGRAVVTGLLAAGHHVRGFDRTPHPTLQDQTVGDLTDTDAVHRAVQGVDHVIHLAAYPNPAPFVDVLIPANFIGAYHVIMAATEANVRRLILASSIQVLGHKMSRNTPATVTEFGPRNDYGLGKLWLEQFGQMIAQQHDIEVLNARIAWFVRNLDERGRIEKNPGAQSVYLAPSDCAQFFRRAVEVPTIDAPDGCATCYVVSRPLEGDPAPFDLEPGRRILGYEPTCRWPDEAPQGSTPDQQRIRL